MGRRGPQKTPTPILALAGSREAVTRSKTEPKFGFGVGQCPKWLCRAGKAEWRRLVPQLEKAGVLQVVDANSLARYVETWVQWRQATQFIRDKGTTYALKDENGQTKYLQQFPQVSIARNLAIQLTRLEDAFGMNPASRSRVEVVKPKDETNTKGRFFTGTG